ncbi:MAG: 5-bromo-4-chloroindolyl phosphate hydrolysis family protein, partial [Schwartzia sp.]|nr:5-bromo-4-chloroindolyl phosphate hydrolysis family protein [Schwartzia sp. (in: firmicutes)]
MAVFYAILIIVSLASGAAWYQAAAPGWAVASGLAAVALGVKGWYELREVADDGTLRLSPPEDLPEELLPERFDKAVEDYNLIHRTLPKIKDSEIRQGYRELQQTGRSILQHLEQHPEKLPRARRFIDYYQDQARSLLVRYEEIEAAGLETAAFREAAEHIREGLGNLSGAYREQLTRLFDDDISAIDADLKVMRQMMDADGITANDGASPADGQSPKAGYTEAYRPHTRPQQPADNPPSDDMAGEPHPDRAAVWSRRAAWEEERRLARRQKVIAGALGVFLGAFGAHKFYFGKTKWGFFYALFCWTGIPGFIGFVEGLRYLFMPLDDFYENY